MANFIKYRDLHPVNLDKVCYMHKNNGGYNHLGSRTINYSIIFYFDTTNLEWYFYDEKDERDLIYDKILTDYIVKITKPIKDFKKFNTLNVTFEHK